MSESSVAGGDLIYTYAPGFHDRLAQHWPEPREQLHIGGWAATEWMVEKLQVEGTDTVLDVCSGEGGTAVWIAELGNRTFGIELVLPAAITACNRARDHGVLLKAGFVCGSIFQLPFRDDAVDVVIGQDPDGFAHVDRLVAFRECFRVLRPGGRLGLQHWIPGVDAPQTITANFDQVLADVVSTSHRDVNADAYILAMRTAGFAEVKVVDRSEDYRRHMLGIQQLARMSGEDVDPWTAAWIDLSEGFPFGVAFFGRNP